MRFGTSRNPLTRTSTWVQQHGSSVSTRNPWSHSQAEEAVPQQWPSQGRTTCWYWPDQGPGSPEGGGRRCHQFLGGSSPTGDVRAARRHDGDGRSRPCPRSAPACTAASRLLGHGWRIDTALGGGRLGVPSAGAWRGTCQALRPIPRSQRGRWSGHIAADRRLVPEHPHGDQPVRPLAERRPTVAPRSPPPHDLLRLVEAEDMGPGLLRPGRSCRPATRSATSHSSALASRARVSRAGFRSPVSRLPMYVRLIRALLASASWLSPMSWRRAFIRSPKTCCLGVLPRPVPATPPYGYAPHPGNNRIGVTIERGVWCCQWPPRSP